MSKILHSINRVFQGGAKSFARFPAAIISALVVAAIASVLIYQDTTANEKIYTSLQLAFCFGAFLGMAVSVATTRRTDRPVPFVLANLASLLIAGGVFALIYYRPGEIPSMTFARVIAASAIAFLAFLLIISNDANRTDYNQASFMTLKSALIAMIYALVIMLGLFFIAFTVKTLLYNDLSQKVYQYIGVWSLLGWFAFFLGYFPDFRYNRDDSHLAVAQKHPAFIEILFAFVLIPIMMAMTVVLVIWSIQILAVGKWPDFTQLTSIFSSYTLFGIFLSIMVAHYVQPIAFWFRRIFPFASFLFLAFEAYAIYSQVSGNGIKTAEYVVSLIWLYVLLTAIQLLVWPAAKNRLSAYLAVLLILAAVLPVIGFQDVPVAAQSHRLLLVLNKNDMLVDKKIKTAPSGISKEDKIAITDATFFLLQDEDISLPAWFSGSMDASKSFQTVFGFGPTYSDDRNNNYYDDYQYTNLFLPDGSYPVSDYDYAISVGNFNSGWPKTIKGTKGSYSINVAANDTAGAPGISVTLDGKTVLEKDLNEWLSSLNEKYKGSSGKEPGTIAYEDMLLKLEQGSLKLLVVFNQIEISTKTSTQEKTFSLLVGNIYLAE